MGISSNLYGYTFNLGTVTYYSIYASLKFSLPSFDITNKLLC